MYGKPVIKGTRTPVDIILEKLSEGNNIEDLLRSYPHISAEHIYAALSFAAERIKNEVVYTLAS